MTEEEMIQPHTTKQAALNVFAPGKENILSFCVDYKRLNEKSKYVSYIRPRMVDRIDSRRKSTFNFTVPLNSMNKNMKIGNKQEMKLHPYVISAYFGL